MTELQENLKGAEQEFSIVKSLFEGLKEKMAQEEGSHHEELLLIQRRANKAGVLAQTSYFQHRGGKGEDDDYASAELLASLVFRLENDIKIELETYSFGQRGA